MARAHNVYGASRVSIDTMMQPFKTNANLSRYQQAWKVRNVPLSDFYQPGIHQRLNNLSTTEHRDESDTSSSTNGSAQRGGYGQNGLKVGSISGSTDGLMAMHHHNNYHQKISRPEAASQMIPSGGRHSTPLHRFGARLATEINPRDFLSRDSFLKPDGFSVMAGFHQIFMLPYYGMSNPISYGCVGVLASLLFLMAFVFVEFPCLILCRPAVHDISEQVCTWFLWILHLIHTVDNDLLLLFIRRKFHKLFIEWRRMSLQYDLSLKREHREKVLRGTWFIIILNLTYTLLSSAFMWPVLQDSVDQLKPGDTYLALWSPQVTFWVVLIVRTIGMVHTKVIESLLIYFSLLLEAYIKAHTERVELTCTCGYQMRVQGKSLRIEEERQTFERLQHLIGETNEILSESIMTSQSINIAELFGATYLCVNLIGHGKSFDWINGFELLNGVTAFLWLLLVASYGQRMITAARDSIRPIQLLDLDVISEVDYRPVEALSKYNLNECFACFDGHGFFRIDKRLICHLCLILMPLILVLAQKEAPHTTESAHQHHAH